MTDPTAYGRLCQPHSVAILDYRLWMAKNDSRTVLWESVSRLMRKKYGKDNLTRLAKDAGIGPGTATRIKDQETSVGIENLDKIADVFGVQAWQLLTPNLDADSLPRIGANEWPLPMVDKARYLNLPPDDRVLIQGYMTRLIEERELSANRRSA